MFLFYENLIKTGPRKKLTRCFKEWSIYECFTILAANKFFEFMCLILLVMN